MALRRHQIQLYPRLTKIGKKCQKYEENIQKMIYCNTAKYCTVWKIWRMYNGSKNNMFLKYIYKQIKFSSILFIQDCCEKLISWIFNPIENTIPLMQIIPVHHI